MVVKVITYGGIIQEILLPDDEGQSVNVVLGFSTLDEYVRLNSPRQGGGPHFGAIIGRYANRIANGSFALDRTTYRLPVNDPPSTLHGGLEGFDSKVWTVVVSESSRRDVRLGLHYTSPDGEEGFPGTLSTDITYALADDNSLRIDYRAETDRDTIVNLTSHTYWNLAGEGSGTILDHLLRLDAERFAVIDSDLIPTGGLELVAGTPLDFSKPTRIGDRIKDQFKQMRIARGYDFSYVLKDSDSPALLPAAHVVEPTTGRTLDVYTTEPTIHFYSGNFLDETLRGTGGGIYPQRAGFALETQHLPDSPNHPSFPETVLRPGQVLRSTTIFRLSLPS